MIAIEILLICVHSHGRNVMPNITIYRGQLVFYNRPLARNVNLRDIPFYVKSVVMLRKTENLSFNHLR